MTYAEFKDFIMMHLWKMGDAVVIANLDNLIQMAESELNRTFKVERRTCIKEALVSDTMLSLPVDYREMRHLTIPTIGDFEYVMPAEFEHFARRAASGGFLPYYTVVNNCIRLIGNFTADVPKTAVMTYYTNIPAFRQTNVSWLADEYLDVYAYCCLKHTAPFLREDDRIPVWKAMFDEAHGGAMEENDMRKYSGSPLKMKFPRGIA